MRKSKHKVNIKSRNLEQRPENKLDYFFYASTAENAEALSRELLQLNYSVEISDVSDAQISFLISGNTESYISDENKLAWYNKLDRMAKKYSCVFDGWGSRLII